MECADRDFDTDAVVGGHNRLHSESDTEEMTDTQIRHDTLDLRGRVRRRSAVVHTLTVLSSSTRFLREVDTRTKDRSLLKDLEMMILENQELVRMRGVSERSEYLFMWR
ncbi:hypothetical protein Tco_0751749 [Tanacetum coccineum]|uniref:Uncharacterized protein n=1 Tax=Tanacetum coccineum TaxID=301880 RepID=A0ABQ4Z8J7_9ASTR